MQNKQINKLLVRTNNLGSEYQEIEYIKGNGIAYIKTDVTLDLMSKYNFECKITSDERNTGYNGGFFGTSNTSYKESFMAPYQYQAGYIFPVYVNKGTPQITLEPSSIINYKLELNFKTSLLSYVLNEHTGDNISFGELKIPTDILLFKSTDYSPQKASMYYFKIYKDDVLIRHYVPCYRKSDNVVGIYDLKTHTFLTSYNVSTFDKGPDVFFKEAKKITAKGGIIYEKLT